MMILGDVIVEHEYFLWQGCMQEFFFYVGGALDHNSGRSGRFVVFGLEELGYVGHRVRDQVLAVLGLGSQSTVA